MQRSTYTRAQINKLWEELAGLPARIQAAKDSIAGGQKKQVEFERSLDELFRSKLNPGKQVNVALQAQIDVLTLPLEIEKLNADIKPHDEKLKDLRKALSDVEGLLKPIDNRIANLKAAIDLWEARENLKQKSAARDECLRTMERFQSELNGLCSQRDVVIKNENAARKSLGELRCELDAVRDARARHEREQQERERLAREQAQYASNAQSPEGYSSSTQTPAATYSSSTQIPVQADDSILLAKIADLEAEVRRYQQNMSHLIAEIERAEHGFHDAEKNKTLCERESGELNEKIINLRNKLSGFSYVDDIRQMNEQFRAENKRRAPHANKRQELQDAINQHVREKKSLELQRDHLAYRLEEARPLTAQFSNNNDLEDLKKQLQAGVKARKDLKIERDKLRKNIADKKNQIKSSQDDLEKMTRRQKVLEGDKFLITFRDSPAELLTRMFDALTRELPAFDYAHPDRLPERVRICLISLQNKANFIMRPPAMAGDDAERYRRQFTELCGLLWEVRAQTTGDHQAFTAMIDRILGKDVIEEVDARASYQLLKNANQAALRDFTVQDLAQHEIQQFEAASQRFAEMLTAAPNQHTRATRKFFKDGENLLKSINDERTKSQQTRGVVTFNYRLHAEILNTSAAMLGNPENAALHTRLAELARGGISGKPSVVKKVFGAIFMFIGGAVALVGGLILAGVVPFVAPPAAPLSIAGGVSLMASGLGLFAGGAALLASGRTKQTAKAIERFDQSGTSVAKNLSREGGYEYLPAEDFLSLYHENRDNDPKPSAPSLVF